MTVNIPIQGVLYKRIWKIRGNYRCLIEYKPGSITCIKKEPVCTEQDDWQHSWDFLWERSKNEKTTIHESQRKKIIRR